MGPVRLPWLPPPVTACAAAATHAAVTHQLCSPAVVKVRRRTDGPGNIQLIQKAAQLVSPARREHCRRPCCRHWGALRPDPPRRAQAPHSPLGTQVAARLSLPRGKHRSAAASLKPSGALGLHSAKLGYIRSLQLLLESPTRRRWPSHSMSRVPGWWARLPWSTAGTQNSNLSGLADSALACQRCNHLIEHALCPVSQVELQHHATMNVRARNKGAPVACREATSAFTGAALAPHRMRWSAPLPIPQLPLPLLSSLAEVGLLVAYDTLCRIRTVCKPPACSPCMWGVIKLCFLGHPAAASCSGSRQHTPATPPLGLPDVNNQSLLLGAVLEISPAPPPLLKPHALVRSNHSSEQPTDESTNPPTNLMFSTPSR